MSRPALTSAIAPQSLTVTAPVALTVNFTPDFTISISTPPPVSINGTVTFTVTVTGQNGFNDAVTLDAPLLPTGASVTFSQNPVYGDRKSVVEGKSVDLGGRRI